MTVSDLSLSQGVLAQVAREWTHQLQTFSTANWSTIAVATPCWDACQSFLKLSTIHCGQSRRKISYSFQMPLNLSPQQVKTWLLYGHFSDVRNWKHHNLNFKPEAFFSLMFLQLLFFFYKNGEWNISKQYFYSDSVSKYVCLEFFQFILSKWSFRMNLGFLQWAWD